MNLEVCKKCNKCWEFYFLPNSCTFACAKEFDSFINTLNFDASVLNELIYLNKVKTNHKNIEVRKGNTILRFTNKNIDMNKKIEKYFLKFSINKKCPYYIEHLMSAWNNKQ